MSIDVTEPQPGVRLLMINRPERRNALDAASYLALISAVENADADSDVYAIIFAGAQGYFTSGNDLDDFRRSRDAGPALGFLRALVLCETPLIAAVEGPAIGIGTTLLLHCDLVVAASSATFRLPFVRLGLTPEAASSYLLPKLAGAKLAAELLLLGDSFSTQVADRAGLLNRVVDDGEALTTALELAVRLGEIPRGALHAARELLHTEREKILEVIDVEGHIFMERLALKETQDILNSLGH